MAETSEPGGGIAIVYRWLPCLCDEGFSRRNLTDPSCPRCNYADDMIDDLREHFQEATAAARREERARIVAVLDAERSKFREYADHADGRDRDAFRRRERALLGAIALIEREAT